MLTRLSPSVRREEVVAVQHQVCGEVAWNDFDMFLVDVRTCTFSRELEPDVALWRLATPPKRSRYTTRVPTPEVTEAGSRGRTGS